MALAGTGAFFGWRVGFENPQSICTESLSGLQPADDAGTNVTEYDFREEKCRLSIITIAKSTNLTPDEQLRKENLYHTKLQCLAEVLSKRAVLDERGAVQDAKAINAAFDAITF
ncbi:hypothetical protein RM406_000112 [Enterobacter kobei]|nr:hypothetical protein [Enterobacter kobei]